MTVPTLGRLTSVSLRDTWIHEAHSFTPWLAKHLYLLADKLGIPLELEEQEVSVGPFYADILARNPTDDSLVLIENQLAISLYLGKNEVGLFVRGPRKNDNGKDLVEKLLPYSKQLSDRLGVVWQQNSNGYCLQKSYKADTSQRDRWDELCSWLHKEADIYEATIREVVESETALATSIAFRP